MTGHSQRSPSQRSFRLSNHGFQPLNAIRDEDNMASRGNDIPLQTVVSHTPSPPSDEKQSEKTGMFNGMSTRGRRQLAKVDSRTGAPLPPREIPGQEKTALNKMGRLYTKILNFSIVTRYMIYVAPIALILAIPIILSQIKVITGGIGDTEPRRFWIWIEISTFAQLNHLPTQVPNDSASLAQFLGYEDCRTFPSERVRVPYRRGQPWCQEICAAFTRC